LPSVQGSEPVRHHLHLCRPEPLLEPGVAVVVVAEALPEARLVLVPQLDPTDPLGALPQIQMGHQQPGRAAMLGLQVLAVVAKAIQALWSVRSSRGRLVL
jgi:hypothetical protein